MSTKLPLFNVAPREIVRGKTYKQWLEEWCKWFLRNDRDDQSENINNGYVMLRGQMRSYKDEENDRVGGKYDYDPLVLPINIKSDTLICFPVLCTLSAKEWEMDRSGELDDDKKLTNDAQRHNDWGMMYDIEVKVNGVSIMEDSEMKNYIVTTDPFDANVEEGPWNDYEGPQDKAMDTIKLSAGSTRIVCNGIFIIGTLPANHEKKYILRIKGNGARGYIVNAIYVIQVD